MSHLNQEAAYCQFGNANWKKVLFSESTLKKKKNIYMHSLEPSHQMIFKYNRG